MIDPSTLCLIMPNARGVAVAYAPHLARAMSAAGITTVTRAAAFLGQLAHESAELRYMEEIADGSAYEGRAELGNVQPGDGKRFKGRGPIQLTGRNNYRAAGMALGLNLEREPHLAAMPEVGFRVAAWYWSRYRLNDLADALDFRGITRAINGGYNGLEQRLGYYHRALEVLGRAAKVPA
jgi:predicted chitinase